MRLARVPQRKKYEDVRGFREAMMTDANRERFVCCFIAKLLTYANGEARDNPAEIERILAQSSAHEYRIVDTL